MKSAIYAFALVAALVTGGAAIAVAGDKDGAKCPDGGCPAGGCPAGGCGGCCDASDAKIVELKTEELAKIVAEKKASIYDCNPAERFARSHVPGAKNVAFDKLAVSDLPADKNAMLVFYCASEKCGACEVAAKKAVELGYKNIAVYRGGIAGWEAAKQATEGAKAAS